MGPRRPRTPPGGLTANTRVPGSILCALSSHCIVPYHGTGSDRHPLRASGHPLRVSSALLAGSSGYGLPPGASLSTTGLRPLCICTPAEAALVPRVPTAAT